MPWGQSPEMTLNAHIPSLTQVVVRIYNFQITGCNSFWKSTVFTFYLWKSPCYKIWPCRKIGQGQPRVIIWTNYDGLESPMLHTKFHGNRSAGSGEEDFWRVFTIYGHGGHLGHVTWISFPLPKEAPHKIWLWLAKQFQRRRCLKMWTDGRTTDTEAWVS